LGKEVEKLQTPPTIKREAKVTTWRRVQLARSCAMGGEEVVKEVKGVDCRAGGVGERIIAAICSQFDKLR